MSDIQVKEQSQETVLQELRKLAESVGEVKNLSGEQKGAFDKMNEELNKFEAKNQELVKNLVEKEKKQEELESKMAKLEAAMNEPSFGAKSEEEQKDVKDLFNQLCKVDLTKSTIQGELEEKALSSFNNTAGGYLVRPDYANQILQKADEITQVKSFMNVVNTSKEAFVIDLEATKPQVYVNGQLQTMQESQPVMGQITIPVYKLAVAVPVSTELLEDAEYNLGAYLLDTFSKAFAKEEGRLAILGSGANEHHGLLTNGNGITARTTSGSAGAFQAKDFFSIQADIPSTYLAGSSFLFNSKTLYQQIRIATDGQGQWLFQPGSEQLPNTVAGRRYILSEDMPDWGTGTTPVVFGNFNEGYYFIERRGLRVIQDENTLATGGQVRFVMSKRCGAGPRLAEALKKLTVA